MSKNEKIEAVALHTVTKSDGLGGTVSYERGAVFSTDPDELERLRRHGAAREATPAEVASHKKGHRVNVFDPVAGRPYSDTEARVNAAEGISVADASLDDLDLGDLGGDETGDETGDKPEVKAETGDKPEVKAKTSGKVKGSTAKAKAK